MVKSHSYIADSDRFLLLQAKEKDREQLDCELDLHPIYPYHHSVIRASPGFQGKATGKV